MNNEIKEILEFDFQSQGERIEINEYERNQIKDYITNLQEENKELGRYYTRANNEFLDLNKRIDKAIEYIKKQYYKKIFDGEYVINADDLLSILESKGE